MPYDPPLSFEQSFTRNDPMSPGPFCQSSYCDFCRQCQNCSIVITSLRSLLFQRLFDLADLILVQPEVRRSGDSRNLLRVTKANNCAGDRRMIQGPGDGHLAGSSAGPLSYRAQVFHYPEISRQCWFFKTRKIAPPVLGKKIRDTFPGHGYCK